MNSGDKWTLSEIKENAEVQERFYGMAKVATLKSNSNKEKQNTIFQSM